MCALFQFLRNTRHADDGFCNLHPKLKNFSFKTLPPLLFAEHNNELGYKIASQNIPWLFCNIFSRDNLFSCPMTKTVQLIWAKITQHENCLVCQKIMSILGEKWGKKWSGIKFTREICLHLQPKNSLGKCWGTHLSFQWWGMDFRARNNWRVIFQKSKNKNPSYPKPVFKKNRIQRWLRFQWASDENLGNFG